MAEELAASVFATLSGNGSVITLEDLVAAIGGTSGGARSGEDNSSNQESASSEELKDQAHAILQRLGAGPECTSISFQQFEGALQGLDENVLRMLAPAATAQQPPTEGNTHGDAEGEGGTAKRQEPSDMAESGAEHSRPLSRGTPSASAGDTRAPDSSHSNGDDLRKEAETETFGCGSDDGAQERWWHDEAVTHNPNALTADAGYGVQDEHTTWGSRSSMQSPHSPPREGTSNRGGHSGRSSVTLTSPIMEPRASDSGERNSESENFVSWAKFAELEQENKALRADNDRLVHRLRDAEQRLKDNETELLELSQEESRMATETTAEISALKREIDRLRKERCEREEREDQAEYATRQELEREHAARIRQLEEEHRKELEAKEAAAVDAQEEALRLKEELEEKHNAMHAQQRRHETEVGVLETQLRTQKAAFEQLEAEAGNLRFAAESLEDMEAENRRLRDRLDEALHANTQEGAVVDGTTAGHARSTRTATAESARPVAFDLAVEQKLDAIKADHRRERARLQMSLIVARLRVESMTKELKEQSIKLVTVKQDNDSLHLQLEVLGKSLADMKRFVDTDNSVVRRLGPRGSGANPLTAFIRRFSVDRNAS